MCGIFGVINHRDKIDRELVYYAVETLKHRGPDDQGIFINKRRDVAIANKRLAILDLSYAGHQPMFSGDGRYIIVYNGEIYNYKELRNEIVAMGCKLRSNCDTEVLLNLFMLYKEKCLPKLRGMFAFAVWDEVKKKLFAARDRFGMKPFYYSHNSSEFVFASELKALKKYTSNLSVSEEGIDAYLKLGSVPSGITIYEGVKSLEPGKYIYLDNFGKISIDNYWSFNELRDNSDDNLGSDLHPDIYKNTYETLLDSITTHSVSDVDVGVFLSGGIDSSSIVSLMSKTYNRKLKTVSINFPGSQLDESVHANEIARIYNTEHYNFALTENLFFNELENYFSFIDQPTIDGINTYFVSKFAHDIGLKVALSGLGGDELFGGYPSFNYIPRINRFISLYRYIPLKEKFLKYSPKTFKKKLIPKVYEFLSNSNEMNAAYKLIRGLYTEIELNELGWNTSSNYEYNFEKYELDDEFSELQKIIFLESFNYMSNQLLRDSDVFSMAHSVELRLPFVDHILYSSVLPILDREWDYKKPKNILVKSVGDLPASVVNRPKMGFTFPIDKWLRNSKLKNSFFDKINYGKIKLLFDTAKIEYMYRNFEKNKVHWSRLWALYVLAEFLEN